MVEFKPLMKTYARLFSVLFMLSALYGTSNLAYSEIPPVAFQESYGAPEIPMSASAAIRSHMALGDHSDVLVVQPKVYLPTDFEYDKLSVSVFDRQGRYHASATYHLDSPEYLGWVTLGFPSNYKNELSRYRAGELVIAARAKSQDGHLDYRLLLSSWSGSPNPLGNFFLNVARGAEISVVLEARDSESNEAKRKACQRTQDVEYEPFSRFNFVCQYELAREQPEFILVYEGNFFKQQPINVSTTVYIYEANH